MSYEYDVSRNSKNYTPGAEALRVFGYAREIEGFTLHWWGDPSTNPSYEGVRDYLCNNAANTSAHIVTTGTGRRAACIVNYSDVAWHSGSAWGNARTIGIELDPRAREEDKDIFAEVLADLRAAFGDKPLYWHNYFTVTTCPGVYRDMIDDLDQRSYKKYSDPVSWGKGGDVTPKTPVTPPPVILTPTTTPQDVLFKVLDSAGKQLGAYAVESGAWIAFCDKTNGTGKITQGGKDLTADLKAKYTTPSPTTKDPVTDVPHPDTGVPVTEKDDFKDIRESLKTILAIVQWIKDKWPFK